MSNPTPPPYGQDPYNPGQNPAQGSGQNPAQNQGPYGQQPPGQQPPYAGQAQYGAPAPPPKKSRTGLIVGVIALVLVLAGAGVAIALVAGGDDDKKDSASEGKSEDTLSDETLGGEGYQYSLPEGWNDATTEAKSQDTAGTIDTVAVWGEELDGSQANVIVEASSGVGEADLDTLRSTWESNMSGASGSTPQEQAGTTIGDEEAIGARFERDNDSGVAIVQIAYLTVHDGTAYSIILSTQEEKVDEATAAYEALLGSWTWES